jgi:guanylate kinase
MQKYLIIFMERPEHLLLIDLNRGKNILFDIDWQGADQVKNKKLDYKLITFFILPPSKEVLFE